MNISGSLSVATQTPHKAPDPQERLTHLIERIESGDIDTDKLQERLSRDFGDAAQGIVSEEGDVNIDELKTLLTNNPPLEKPPHKRQELSADSGMIPPPPRAEDLTGKLVDLLGEDTASSFINAEGHIDFDTLFSVLKENMPAAENGTLVSIKA